MGLSRKAVVGTRAGFGYDFDGMRHRLGSRMYAAFVSGRKGILFVHVAAVALLALSALCALPAKAIMREVDPGEIPKLGANDGLLLVSVDSEVTLEFVRISREGVNFDVRTLHAVKAGRNSHLYVVPAGHYRWATLGYIGEYRLSKNPEFAFDVKPGVLNYPGDLIFRPTGWLTALVHVSNRGLLGMDWLQSQHPVLYRDRRFEFAGRYPDPFPALYREAIAGGTPPEDKTALVPPSGALPFPLEELWRPSRLQMIELNPRGDLFAEVTMFREDVSSKKDSGEDKKPGAWHWAVNLVDIEKGSTVRLLESLTPFSRIDWTDDRSLIMSVGEGDEPAALIAANILDTPEGRSYDKVILPRRGVLVKVLQDRPGHILFASQSSSGRAMVHELDIRSQNALNRFDFTAANRLNSGIDEGIAFYADAAGRVRMAIVYDKKGRRLLMHGVDGDYREVMELDEAADFIPMGLSADGDFIYGLAEQDRGQRDLVELDPSTGKVTRTVFSKPGFDVVRPMFAPSGKLIGASYYQDGLLISHYFEDSDINLTQRLSAAFPGKAVTIIQRNPAGRRFLVAVSGSDQPTNVYFFDADASNASLVSETKPWLSLRSFVPATTLHVKSRDGFDIEAYLTLPAGSMGMSGGNIPLVLFPHGGPIGVRDNRYFDPEVQILAALGYAVLQVNFRGSEGFGTAFRKAGERGYGSVIEDDIDTALTAALAQYPLDRKRICAMGASYGGYSAMVSAIRWPGRFRCAISMSGISDRALFFTASDSARSKEGRKAMERIIGNPNTDMDEMRMYSPLYRYRELTLPILLIHGNEDLRVDFEHSRRLVRMLNIAGRPPALIELKGEGHSIDDEANRTRAWEAVAGFLREYLGDPLKSD
jgi:dipeptidyl aminopeptidase/acylaminoacyl peptidase